MSALLTAIEVLCCLLQLGLGVPVYVKENGVFKQVPGDYLVIPNVASKSARSKRALLSTGEVFLNGTKQTLPMADIYKLFAELTDPQERINVLAPPDARSTGFCEVRETITWPARCYPTSSESISICRSNARGIIEIKTSACEQNIDLYDWMLRHSTTRRSVPTS